MASTIKVNSIEAQSSTDINIPTGYKLKVADAGELYIGGTPITTGALGTIAKTASYDIQTSDYTGKSVLTVFENANAGTNTVFDIKLPTAANFASCSVNVVSTNAHGSGNSIPVKDNAGNEIYTLYHKGDHVEIQSDGTNVFRTGNEFATVRSQIALTSNVNMTAATTKDIFNGAGSSNYSVVENIGGGWNSTTHDFIAPHAGLYRFGGHVAFSTSAYMKGWLLKQNTAWLTNEGTGINNDYSGGENLIEFPISLASGDSIEFWMQNHSGVHDAVGDSTSTNPRCRADCWMLRRY